MEKENTEEDIWYQIDWDMQQWGMGQGECESLITEWKNKYKIALKNWLDEDNTRTTVCCGVLERMQLGWMQLEDGTRCMPYIKGYPDDNNMYRVNNCPSCGKYVRDVMLEP